MSQKGKPIYTPKQLMKEGMQAGAGQFMQLMLNMGSKPSQFNQMLGGNWRNNPAVQFIEKIFTNEDGTTRTVQVPLVSKPQNVNEYMKPEYFNQIEFAEYQGPYHKYPNGAVMTGASYSEDSVPLIKYSTAVEMAERIDHVLDRKRRAELLGRDEESTVATVENADKPVRSPNNSIYFKLTGKRFDLYLNPKYYYPEPDERDYEKGYIDRFFAQKINDRSSIIEVSREDYASANTENAQGLDDGVLNLATIEWTIAGPIADARKANDRVTLYANGNDMPGLISYLTDLDEFHKRAGTLNSEVEINLYTPGGEFLLPNGQVYVGSYHIHPDKGPMVGAEHTLEHHDRLIPIRDDEERRGTGGGGGFI